MEPAADGSPMEIPTAKAPVRAIPTSVHVWLWIFVAIWIVSFLVPAVSIMGGRPGRGWQIAWDAFVLFFVPVKGMWLIFIPGIWLVWMNLFMLIAPSELKQLERGEGRIYAVLFSIGTAITIGIAYSPLSGATGLEAGFYFWTGSLIATAGLFVRNLWPNQYARLPAACLMAALLALPVYRGEVDFLPSALKPETVSKPALNHAVGSPVRITTTRLVDSSPNPSLIGNPVTFKAVVAASGAGTPGGTITFVDSRTLVGKAHTTAGEAMVSTNVLKPGAHFITANFAGDAATNYVGSTSDGLIQMVNDPGDAKTQTVLTVVERHQEQRADQLGFTLKAKVTASGSNAAVTTGEVTFVFMYAF